MTDLIKYYLGFVDRHEKDTWSNEHFFSEIIKQRILLKYLNSYLFNKSDVKDEVMAIRKINRFCFLRYCINDHLNLAEKEDIL